jgi:hypothetical protein
VGANRVFAVGTLAETADVGSDAEYRQGTVFAADSPVYVYADRYQPEAMAALKAAEPSMSVAVVRKLRTYERGERINVAIEPESITEADAATRDAWVAETAVRTQKRLDDFETERAASSEQTREACGGDVSLINDTVAALTGTDTPDDIRSRVTPDGLQSLVGPDSPDEDQESDE